MGRGFAASRNFMIEGHCLVSKDHNEDGFRLGGWVDTQRQSKDGLDPERLQRLNDISFVWNVLSISETGFAALKKFTTVRPLPAPIDHKEDGLGLVDGWIHNGKAKTT